MSCLKNEEIYAFIEGELSERDGRRLEAHAAGCAGCGAALEDRRAFLAAAESLPSLNVPEGFAAGILRNLPPESPPFRIRLWLASMAAGIVAFSGTLAAIALLSGQNLGAYLAHLSQAGLGYFQDAATTAVKLMKYIFLFFKVTREFAAALFNVFKQVTAFIGPEAQASFLIAALFLLAAGVTLRRRRFASLENRHAK